MYEVSSFLSFAPLSPETDMVPPLMVEEDNKPKENLPIPLDLGGANNAAPKKKPPSSFLFIFQLVFVGTVKASGGE